MLLKLVVAWILGSAALYVGLTAVEFPQRLRYSTLIANEALALGTVTKCEPSNHYTFTTRFSVGATAYESGGFIDDIGACYVGKQVTVNYEADNPSNSCVCDPSYELATTWQVPITATLLLSPTVPIVYWAVFLWRGRRLDTNADENREVLSFSGEPVIRPRRSWSRPGLPHWLWSSGRVLYELPLESSDVMKRISGALQSEFPAESERRGAVLAGWIQGRRFHVTTTGGPAFRSWLESTLDGTIGSSAGGSLLIAEFCLRGFLVAYGIACLAFAAVIAVSTIAAWITHTPQPSLVVVVPFIVALALFVLGRVAGSGRDGTLLTALDQLFAVDKDSP
jgi:hypothetical protein